jgi:uncharacterized protein YceH (UPF0502 family)
VETDEPKNQIRDLTSVQCRVIGALMEKAYTTPDQYPLTLKSLTSACNQKSNRDPVTNYDEGAILSTLDELREMSLIAEVYTDGGRAPRYRHYMRYRFDFSETQFAILAELLLRGGQQPGELRTRASRMKRIESQDALRSDLAALQEKGFVTASGPLDRRGVTVDHTFYPGASTAALLQQEQNQPAPIEPPDEPSSGPALDRIQELQDEVTRQRQELDELKLAVERLEDLMR